MELYGVLLRDMERKAEALRTPNGLNESKLFQ